MISINVLSSKPTEVFCSEGRCVGMGIVLEVQTKVPIISELCYGSARHANLHISRVKLLAEEPE